MIFEYDRITGMIYNGVCSREVRGGSDNMFDSKPQKQFMGDNGLPSKIPANHRIKYVRDSMISAQYLHFIRDSNGQPNFKFVLKDGNPVKIVPIKEKLPLGWRCYEN